MHKTNNQTIVGLPQVEVWGLFNSPPPAFFLGKEKVPTYPQQQAHSETYHTLILNNNPIDFGLRDSITD